jgi:flagella basal body P-ring formation protein FlgA
MSLHALALLPAAAVAAGSVDVESLLLEKLRERYPAVARWEIRPFDKLDALDADAATVLRLGSRSAVRVGGRVYWYAVAGYEMALSAARAVRTGEPLEPSSAQLEEIDAMAAACTPLTDPSRLTGARATRAIRVDQVMCEESIEPKPPVARGDEVTVRYVGTSITLMTKGVSETDGVLGQSVEIKKADSADRYLAVVSGAREVTINE